MVQNTVINSRVLVVLLVLLSVLVFIILRIADLQIQRGAYYKALAQANRQFTSIIPRQRGLILDRFGEPLTVNIPSYQFLHDPQVLYSDQDSISHSQAVQLLATQSAHVAYSLHRQYLAGTPLSHVLGYTAAVSAEDLAADDSLLMTDQIGKLGLERAYERQIRGQPGKAIFAVNALGQKQQLLERTAPTPGDHVTTTLDPSISAVAYQALDGRQGSVVILDASDGSVISLVSSPGFDPNLFSQQSSDSRTRQTRQQEIAALLQDDRNIFFNRATSGLYPPGSVFKIVTALAALDSGAVEPEDTVLDEGVLRVGDFSYANWFYTQQGGTDGEIAIQRALARSNDIYFYKAAEWVGPNRLAEYARRFSFGQPSELEIPGSAAGLVPDVEWKEQVIGERWFLGNTYHYGIGQGDVLVTPLQVAQMTQAVANYGSLCPAHLLHSDTSVCRGLSLSDESLEVVVAGLLDACSAGGTGYPFFPWNEQYRDQSLSPYQQVTAGAVACKTGTSEFGGQDSRGFRRTHGWFTMFVNIEQLLADQLSQSDVDADTSQADIELQSDQQASLAALTDQEVWAEKVAEHDLPTQVVITVLVESDEETPYREGSRDAAPIALEIVQWMLGQETVPAEESTEDTPEIEE
ncbi:MAG: penicillin-binding transpeptidase domain-containing protein [Patescibacteria group bacterium]